MSTTLRTSPALTAPMTVHDLREAVTVLSARDDIRAGYRSTFIAGPDPGGTDRPHLWAHLRHCRRVTLARLWETLASSETVCLMWDAGPDGHPTLADREFGTGAVVACATTDLERVIEWLPDDLYVFDPTLTWTAVFTHRRDGDGCVVLLASPVGSPVG